MCGSGSSFSGGESCVGLRLCKRLMPCYRGEQHEASSYFKRAADLMELPGDYIPECIEYWRRKAQAPPMTKEEVGAMEMEGLDLQDEDMKRPSRGFHT